MLTKYKKINKYSFQSIYAILDSERPDGGQIPSVLAALVHSYLN